MPPFPAELLQTLWSYNSDLELPNMAYPRVPSPCKLPGWFLEEEGSIDYAFSYFTGHLEMVFLPGA